MIGMDCDDATLEMAIAMESVDEVIPMDRPHLMSRADLVIVAIPPHKIVEFILENKDNFRKGAVVTDVCGVKKHIVDSLTEPLAETGVEFIGSHPMAGTEFSGFSFSLADMFVNASYLITPTEKSDPAKVEILRRLAYDIGFKTVIETTGGKARSEHRLYIPAGSCRIQFLYSEPLPWLRKKDSAPAAFST